MDGLRVTPESSILYVALKDLGELSFAIQLLARKEHPYITH